MKQQREATVKLPVKLREAGCVPLPPYTPLWAGTPAPSFTLGAAPCPLNGTHEHLSTPQPHGERDDPYTEGASVNT